MNNQWEALKKDIAEKGVLHPITLYEGKILDGRARYVAATELGIDCPFNVYEGDDPVGFLMSVNFYRRHLSKSEWAIISDLNAENFEQQIVKLRLLW